MIIRYLGGIDINKNKLLIFLVVLTLFLISIGSVTAIEDNNETFVTSVDLDVNINEKASVDVIEVNNQENSVIVKNSTFTDFFNLDGTLKDEVTVNELIFEGNFSNLGVTTITIDKKLSIVGNQAIINDIQFILSEKEITFSKMTLKANNCDDCLIYILADDISLNNNTLIVNGKDSETCRGIYIDTVNNISITKNIINFEANGTAGINNFVIYADTVNNLTIKDNIIDSILPSLDVGYDASWQATPYSATIFITNSENAVIINNNVKIKANVAIGSYDTLYGIYINSANNFKLFNNTIEIKGKKYTYAIRVGGSMDSSYHTFPCENFNISDNIIISKGDYDAHGIELGSPVNGIIVNNAVTVCADNVTYGIYSYAMNGPITVDYINNTINSFSNSVYGFELCGTNEKIYDNTIVANGNFTIGIASGTKNMIIEGNEIFANGEGNGKPTTGDSFTSQNVGILLNKNAQGVIQNNTIKVNNGTYAIDASKTKNAIEIKDNDLSAKELISNSAVLNGSSTIIEENYNIIYNNTFFSVFDENGNLLDSIQDGNILIFSGEFKELGISNITINKAIKLIGNEATLNNIGLNITSDNVVVNDFELNINNLETAIVVAGNNVTLTNNRINYNATKGKNSIVINANEIANLTISDNNITYIGDTDGSSKNTVILMDEIDGAVISGNKITGSLSSVPVNWKQVGSDWVSDVASLVISAKGSNIDIINNNINTTCGEVSGYYDTIYGIQIAADNVTLKDNNIAIEGSEYLYATSISGKNITIDNNNITSSAKSSHAYGMELTTMGGGEFDGIVSNNNIEVSAPVMAYGITSYGNVNVTYDNNVIDVNANTTIGLEAQGINENITNNKITSNGNYVVGIGSASAGKLIISDNNINITGNGQGVKDTGDSMAVGNVGIYVKNNVENATVSNNNITANIPSRSWTSQNAGLIVGSSNTLIDNNKIDVTAVNQEGAYDSVYGAKITGDNSNVTNNVINVKGLNYTYGMSIGGENVLVDGNNMTVSCSGYYAGAINVNSPFKGNVSDNNIKISAVNVTYGIYDWGNVNATYANNTIDACANSVYAIEACGNVQEILNNTINAKGNYTIGIAGSATGSLNIKDNNINVDGAGLGTPTGGDTIKSINAGIYLTNYVKSANVEGNVINANIATVPYGENGAAIVSNASNTKINNNKINATVSNSASDWNSFYGVQISGDNTTFNNNNMSVTGEGYTYGLVASADNVSVDSNNIDVVNDKNYACGVNLNAPFTGEVSDNNITVNAKDSAYGIYTSQWGGNTIEGNYTGNNIDVTAKTTYAMELMGEKEIVDENVITANGEYTMGIATSTKDISITNNTIVSNGTGNASAFTYDMFGATNEGILIYDNKTQATITENDIESTGNFAVNVLKSKNNQTKVTNNTLMSATNKGDGAVNNIEGVIANNTPINNVVLITNDFSKYYKNGTNWKATLTDANGTAISGVKITFTINGVSYNKTTDTNGVAVMNINLNPGIYDCLISYKNDTNSVVKAVTITVLSTIYGNNTVLYFRNGTKYNALFLDGQGKPLVGAKVKFNINGIFYERTTDATGMTSGLNINLKPGNYTITAIAPNGEKRSNTITVLSIINSSNLVKYYKNGSQFVVKALDKHGNALAGQKVSFNINGIFYYRTTDANGTATLNINLAAGNSIPKEYIITTSYNGCMVSNTITVLPVLTAENLVAIYKNKDKFNIKLVDGQGKPLSGANIVFNINGMFYSRTTGTDGTTSGLTINLIPGEYIITSVCKDNGATISNKITVVK